MSDQNQDKHRVTRRPKQKKISKLIEATALQEGAKFEIRNGKLIMIEAPPPPKPLEPVTIEVGREYRALNGNKVKVIAVNSKSKARFPVVGIEETEEDGWAPRVWDSKGLAKRPFGAGSDIIANWGES